ncbi:MAG: hypothetical protein DHS20C16_06380 [Phycisphaerae bacterium]|nr:MAG: hypothetical protein DHS20C16_06380 [Phycisphaerae bacterium]
MALMDKHLLGGRRIAPGRAFTLVELLVVVSIIALLISILLPTLTRAREQARTVKCLANQHSQGLAILMYASEYQGVLPGPIHPAIKRKTFSITDPLDRQKSLTWLLRPYYSKSQGNANQEDSRADEISSCPTAERVVPDQDFFDFAPVGSWQERPYSYVANTWGITDPGPTVSKAIASDTDPPHYFGAWFYTNNTPEVPGVAWWPKKIDRIKRPGEEWAVADAWYRRTSTASGRSGSANKEWYGTFVPEINNYLPIIPDRPYHRISARKVSSHARTGKDVLPQIRFKGSTSMVFFDGHAGLFFGQWRKTGDGGTVNPFWSAYDGKHDINTFQWNPNHYQ